VEILSLQDAGSHMNLGAMLHLNGKFVEAEESYLKSLELRPGDPTTLTNLERLHNLFSKHGINKTGMKQR
jgi:Flp pilus assembly protein TadD